MIEYLLGVGTMKGGTTTLYDLLSKHPGFSLAPTKEQSYFEQNFAPVKDEYDALFAQGGGVKLDITPRYMFFEDELTRISQTLGAERCGVVVILRDPIERAFSHYNMNLMWERESEPFEKCMELCEARMKKDYQSLEWYSYFPRGLYARQMDAITRLFPRENIRVFVFEDFVKNQQAVVDEICDLANLPHIKVTPLHDHVSIPHYKNRELNKRLSRLAGHIPIRLRRTSFMMKLKVFLKHLNEDNSKKKGIDPRFLERLKAYYLGDALRLRDEYGVDISKWKNFQDLR